MAAGHDVRLVITQKDKRRGRGSALVPSPVKAAATDLGLPVSHRVDDVLAAGVELGVVVAFGRLIRPHVLERVPMVNVHFSLLPRWRGAAPVERAILAGDPVTGVGIMQLEEGLDTGPVYAEEALAIDPEETADELRARLVEAGTRLLLDTLSRPLEGATPQQGEPSYAAKIDPAELQIDWAQPAIVVHRVIRVGRAWTSFRGKRLHVLRARAGTREALGAPGTIAGTHVTCGDGASLELVEVRPEGKAAHPAAAWLNGARVQPTDRLGS